MKNKLTNEDIDAIQAQCAEQVWEPFPGITISDQSGCIDPKNYDRGIGVEICREHLRDKLWQLYGFALKEQFGRGDA